MLAPMKRPFVAIVLTFAGALPALAVETVYVVRHAQKSNEDAWSAHGRLRPLTEKGARCTARLVAELADAEVAAVYSSETARTLSTGLAVSAGLEATVTGDDITIRDPAGFAERVRSEHDAAKAILVVGHSNTVGALIAAFQPEVKDCAGRIGLRSDVSVDETRYGDVWRIDLGRAACDGGVRHSDLGAADGLDCTTP